MNNKSIFLDRDGLLNVEKNYLYKWEDWEWLPNVIESLQKFKKAGYKLVVISNQSGIARGYYCSKDVDLLHKKVNQDLKNYNIQIDAFYYCPHHPDFGGACLCRKPETGLFLQAAKDLSLNIAQSYMFGDKVTDLIAAKKAGCKDAFLVLTGYGLEEKKKLPVWASFVENLSVGADLVIQND